MRKAIIGVAALVTAGGALAAVGLSRPAPHAAASAPERQVLLAPPAMRNVDRAMLQAATDKASGDAGAWIALADRNLRDKRFAEAITAYQRGLAIDPSRAESWSALGEAYIQSERSETAKMPADARAAFDRALALDKDDMRANFYGIMERDFAGQHDRAIGEWLAMLRRAPMGSDADEAIRAAIAASINRNLTQVKVAMADATRAQPRLENAPVRN